MVGIVSSSVKALCLAAVVFVEVSDAFMAPAVVGGGLSLRQGASSGAVSGLRMAGFGKADDGKAKRGSQAKTKLMGGWLLEPALLSCIALKIHGWHREMCRVQRILCPETCSLPRLNE